MRSSKRYLLVIAVATILGTSVLNVFAQDSTSSKSNEKRGDWALQFQIDQNFTLSDFNGTLISYQKTLSPNNAVRLGLSLGGNYHKSKQDNITINGTNFNLGINIKYLWYKDLRNQIRFYYGIGPIATFLLNQTKSKNNIYSSSISTQYVVGLGAGGVTGVEWFVHPDISLLAEYSPFISSNYSHTRLRQDANKDKKTVSTLSVGSNVRFGVSVYF